MFSFLKPSNYVNHLFSLLLHRKTYKHIYEDRCTTEHKTGYIKIQISNPFWNNAMYLFFSCNSFSKDCYIFLDTDMTTCTGQKEVSKVCYGNTTLSSFNFWLVGADILYIEQSSLTKDTTWEMFCLKCWKYAHNGWEFSRPDMTTIAVWITSNAMSHIALLNVTIPDTGRHEKARLLMSRQWSHTWV